MNYKPILFSGPMVRAILEERKTQTRRVVKFKSLDPKEVGAIHPDGSGTGWIAWQPGKNITAEFTKTEYPGADGFKCPYGNIGDILWVRETFVKGIYYDDDCPVYDENGDVVEKIWYRADNPDLTWCDCGDMVATPWKPSIHMPKIACRIFLQIEDIRVERLRDISEADCIAEGIVYADSYYPRPPDGRLPPLPWKNYQTDGECLLPIDSYSSLWKEINGEGSWSANPWVWVIAFKRIDKPSDFIKDTGGKTDRE